MEHRSDLPHANNPLYHDVVLEKVVKYIRRRDLLRCRQVCHKWNAFIVPRVRSEYEVYLTSERTEVNHYPLSFVCLVERSFLNPFGTYRLHNLNMIDPIVERFFVICGSYIRSLRIEISDSSCMTICSFRELLLYRVPNLQVLSIEGKVIPEEITKDSTLFPQWAVYRNECPVLKNLNEINFTTEEDQCFLIQVFLSGLLAVCPNLKRFTSTKDSYCNMSATILDTIRSAGHFRNLNCLNLSKLNDDDVLSLVNLSKCGLSLKDFSFEYLEQVENKTFQDLINLQHRSLEVLTMGEVGTKNSKPMKLDNFLVMPKLKTLKRIAVNKNSTILFDGTTCYAKCAPSLENLIVYGFADEIDWDEYFPHENSQFPCNSLKMLELPINLDNPGKLQKFGKMFPNVLKIVAKSSRNEVISHLWNMWPDLQELHLTLSEKNVEIDSIFTGIPSFVRHCGTMHVCKHSEDIPELTINNMRVKPSITNLRALKKLHLETELFNDQYSEIDDHTTCFLTDITGYMALSFLTQLEEITVKCSQLSEACCLRLKKRFFPFTKIYFTDRDHFPIFYDNSL